MTNAQPKTAIDPHALEYTCARIYAYLHALQPLAGCEVTSSYHRGRELVAILAETSEGDGMPKRRLTLGECADVIAFMYLSEPRDRKTFLTEPRGQPSMECGYHIVLTCVEAALRNAAARRQVKKAV